jgi:hypothetical protein
MINTRGLSDGDSLNFKAHETYQAHKASAQNTHEAHEHFILTQRLESMSEGSRNRIRLFMPMLTF